MSQNVKPGTKAAVSRIGSFKRDWDDDKDNEGSVIDWPLSPEQPPRKKQAILPKPSVPDNKLTPAERRLRAIQAAIDGTSTSSSLSTTSSASSRSTSTAKSFSSTSMSTSTTATSSSSSGKTRELPWNASHADLKKGKAVISSSKPMSTSTSAAEKVGAVFLSSEQRYVVQQALAGKNVFFTGSAGTGKSVVLREIISGLRKKHSRKGTDALAITASTGIAACTIGGVTLHAFAGAGICAEPPEQLAAKIRKNKKSASRWLRVEALIIDEISMVDGELFDKLAKVAMIMKKSSKPFGGIQLIVTGDFFQLPPVTKTGQTKFAFEASLWSECIQVTFNLTQVFRQKDQEFVDMLNRMRLGEILDKDTKRFKQLSRTLMDPDGIEPTELFPRREDVERSNKTRMTQLRGETRIFKAIDGGTMTDPNQREKALANFMAPGELHLCIDSQVMLIKNTDDNLVNGSMGRVVGFCDPAAFRKVIVNDQGVEEIDRIEEIFDLTTKEGKRAAERRAKMNIEEVPVVGFKIPGGKTEYMLVQRETFKNELPNGEVQVSRSQFPLILAWAMSIHKSQGQTLERVKVDLGRVFEKGQAYVALSRATSLQGLQVLNFDPKKVVAHPKVIAWYKTLPTSAVLVNDDDEE